MHREYKEKLVGDNTVDFAAIVQKAKTKSLITKKQNTYLTHMRDELSLDLMKKGGVETTTELDPRKLKKSLK